MSTQPSSREEQETKQLNEELKPQTAPTPEPSRTLGAKEEEVNREQVDETPDSDSPGG
jgi:hypothetical protein